MVAAYRRPYRPRRGRRLQSQRSILPYLTRGGQPLGPVRKRARPAASSTAGAALPRRRPPLRRRRPKTGTAVHQWTKQTRNVNLSKKMTTAQQALRLIKSQVEPTIFRWNGVKNFDDNGYYWMSNVSDGTYRFCPLYLMDLTSILNQAGANFLSPYPLLTLRFNSTTGQASFFPRASVPASGSGATNTWQFEQQPNNYVYSSLYTKSMLEWVSVKLNCWGVKRKSTRWIIELVQFNDEDLVPMHDAAADLAIATSNSTASYKRTEFYQNLTKQLMYNPIASTGGMYSKRMKVIRRTEFIIQPSSTVDGDEDPQVRVVNQFIRLNRVCNYLEGAKVLSTEASLADTAAYGTPSGDQIRAQVNPTQRLYLMIRASNYGLDAVEDNTGTPSMDLVVRTKHINVP